MDYTNKLDKDTKRNRSSGESLKYEDIIVRNEDIILRNEDISEMGLVKDLERKCPAT